MITNDEQGFSLVEILVALAIFGIVVVGTLGVIGANTASGLSGTFPTAFVAGRGAKDYTAASSYLQGLQEFVATNSGSVTPQLYCTQGTGTCPAPTLAEMTAWCPSNNYAGGLPVVGTPAGLAGAPMPSSAPYELAWTNLYVLVEPWYWDDRPAPDGQKYSATAPVSADTVMRVCSVLQWELKGFPRRVNVDRFLP